MSISCSMAIPRCGLLFFFHQFICFTLSSLFFLYESSPVWLFQELQEFVFRTANTYRYVYSISSYFLFFH